MADADALHSRVEKYMRDHPAVLAKHTIMRVSRRRPGEYDVDGRAVRITWDAQKDQLLVIDGPMQQPLSDYIRRVESTVQYSSEGLNPSNLNMLPQEARVTFQDPGVGYSRLDAMKVAKEQAKFREKAADFAKAGQTVPQDLIEKYEKNIEMKLGKRWSKENRSMPLELPAKAEGAPPPTSTPAPAWWAGAAAAVSVQPAASATRPVGAEVAVPAAVVPAVPSGRSTMTPTAVIANPMAKAAAAGAPPVEDVGYDRAELMKTMFVKRSEQGKQSPPGSAVAPAVAPTVAAPAPAIYTGIPGARVAQAPKAAPMQPTAVQAAAAPAPAAPLAAVPELHTQLVSNTATAGLATAATPKMPSMVIAQPQIVSASAFEPKSAGSRPGNIYGALQATSAGGARSGVTGGA